MDTANIIMGIIIDDVDPEDMSSILNKWREINVLKKKLDELDEILKNKMKAYLKQRKWDKYNDPSTNISVTIDTQRREVVDKDIVKEFLTEAQYAQAVKITTFEKMCVVTPESKERLKQYVRKKINGRI